MTIQVDAIYERGTFRPASPVTLNEGTQVVLTINTETSTKAPQQLVAALIEIAAMPAQSIDEGFSGADHDQILYGPQGAR